MPTLIETEIILMISISSFPETEEYPTDPWEKYSKTFHACPAGQPANPPVSRDFYQMYYHFPESEQKFCG